MSFQVGADVSIILRAEADAERILKEAQERAQQAVADAQKVRELRMKAITLPEDRTQKSKRQGINTALLTTLAARNKEAAIKRIMEEFDAAS